MTTVIAARRTDEIEDSSDRNETSPPTTKRVKLEVVDDTYTTAGVPLEVIPAQISTIARLASTSPLRSRRSLFTPT